MEEIDSIRKCGMLIPFLGGGARLPPSLATVPWEWCRSCVPPLQPKWLHLKTFNEMQEDWRTVGCSAEECKTSF